VTLAVDNDPDVTSRASQAASQALPGVFIHDDHRTMGSEDMSYMMQDIPGCYFFVGSHNSAAGLDAPHHNPKFDFDEAALPQAAAAMAAAAWSFLA
jgi:amidohydrolase